MTTSSVITQQQILPEQSQLAELVASILRTAQQQGASSAAAAVSFNNALSVNVRLGEVEKLQHHRNRGLGVSVYFGQRKGSASTSDWSTQAVHDTVLAACDIARYTAADEYAGLADPDTLAQNIADLQLYHPWNLSTDDAIRLATECEDSAREFDAQIKNSDGASVSSSNSLSYYGNSHGFSGGYSSTRHGLSCTVIASNDSGMQRNYWFSVARDQKQLESARHVGIQAAERAVQRLNARRLDTRTAPVLFIPEIARSLIAHFISAVSGTALYRKTSFLVDHLGQQVFPGFLQLNEEPHLYKALASAPFDAEGVATTPRCLVKDGIVQGYVLDSYAARRLGMATTGNSGGIHNLLVSAGELDFAGLLKEMHTGLIVTQLMGQGINLLTGDYSRGAAGLWVENGVIQYPVEEITIAGNLRDMFLNIAASGCDIDQRGAIRCGSLLLESMTIAGT